MNIVSFLAPRPEHPFFQDYTPFLDLLAESCERYGHQHVCLTDDPAVRDGYVVDLPRSLMRAYLAAQLAYLESHPNTPSLMTGADCVLARDPAVFESQRGASDIVITTDRRFLDCHINMGAIYMHRPGLLVPVWRDALARCGDEWGDDQRAFRDALEASDVPVRELPCDPYNLAPEYPGDDCRRGAVLHFRGPRKDWMADYCHKWLGIGEGVQLKMAANTDDATGIAQIAENMRTPREMLTLQTAHDGVTVIVGSGPSAADDLPMIRRLADSGAHVFALNGAARWLTGQGIIPHFGVILDMREGNARFLDGVRPRVRWLLASHCHPGVVGAAGANGAILLYHHGAEAYHPHLPPGSTLIGGGPTVGITAMYLACMLGFRRIHLFGYDSSFRDGQTHLLPQPTNDVEAAVFEVHVGARSFHTNAGMYAQAGAFEPACGVLYGGMPDLEISVHGDGLLPAIAHQMIATAAEAA
jgi:uncharacterized Rossmann fold enzyme